MLGLDLPDLFPIGLRLFLSYDQRSSYHVALQPAGELLCLTGFDLDDALVYFEASSVDGWLHFAI